MFKEVFENVRKRAPLVHCITNYVTVNDVANCVLASGGAPIMADDEEDAAEITKICSSLVINIGTLNKRTIASMFAAGKAAREVHHPIILDPVGAGASQLRTKTAIDLIHSLPFAVIRGNISEIKTVYEGSGSTKGVEADEKDAITASTLDSAVITAKNLAKRTGSIAVITGAVDIVTDGKKTYTIANGHPVMSKITGSGCMLTSLIGVFAGANPDSILDATAAAVVMMGVAGERAQKKMTKNGTGTSSFRTNLIDEISLMNYDTLSGGMKVEIR